MNKIILGLIAGVMALSVSAMDVRSEDIYTEMVENM